jgi:hypothetical protein
MNATPFTRTVPIKHDVDIFVAGGGPAGLAAAVTAARQGARVFLAEGSACFGGMGTAAGLPMFCEPTDGVNLTTAGFGTDVYERLIAAGGTAPETRGQPLTAIAFFFNPEILKRVYDDLAVASGLRFAFQTQFLDVQVEDGTVTHAICAAKSGLFAVKAKVFVDGTGDGDLAARAGAPFEKGDARGAMQPPTLMSLWTDIDWEKANRSGCGVWQQDKYLPRAFQDKVFTTEDRHLPGMIPTGPHTAWANIGHLFGTDGTDEDSLTQAFLRGRKLLLEYERFYKEYLSGFENMQLLSTGALLGVRETRRIMGDYVLNLADFKARAVFADEIGRFSYPVDLHATRPDKASFDSFEREFADLRYKRGESYGIPYRCLTPRKLQNVLVAGRCVSCDRHIQGSLRVMPACFLTGQAAGMAAAMAAGAGLDTRRLDVTELQARLLKMGAYLPNARNHEVHAPA